MGHAARIYTTPETVAANDNGPTDKDVDRWHLLIERMKVLHTPLAIQCAYAKLRGEDFDRFTSLLLAALESR